MKEKISYTLLGLSFLMVLVYFLNVGMLMQFTPVYMSIVIVLMVVGGCLYSTGYVKRIVVVEKIEGEKDNFNTASSEVPKVPSVIIVDEDGDEYRCSDLLSDIFEIGEYYMVKLSYDGEIIGIVG